MTHNLLTILRPYLLQQPCFVNAVIESETLFESKLYLYIIRHLNVAKCKVQWQFIRKVSVQNKNIITPYLTSYDATKNTLFWYNCLIEYYKSLQQSNIRVNLLFCLELGCINWMHISLLFVVNILFNDIIRKPCTAKHFSSSFHM